MGWEGMRVAVAIQARYASCRRRLFLSGNVLLVQWWWWPVHRRDTDIASQEWEFRRVRRARTSRTGRSCGNT